MNNKAMETAAEKKLRKWNVFQRVKAERNTGEANR
jgi:hypothetical protein